jgi:hypothetical protein
MRKILYKFAAFENCDDNVKINRSWESIRGHTKT